MSRNIQPIRVLALDDEQSVLKLYGTILSRPWQVFAGQSDCAEFVARIFGEDAPTSGVGRVRTTFCDNPADAIEHVRQGHLCGDPFALAFLDVNLRAEIDGVTVAERMRVIDHNMHVVLVTGDYDPDAVELSTRIPPADRLLFLEKPFQPSEIRQFVLALGTKWRVEEQLRRGQEWMFRSLRSQNEQLEQANRALEVRIEESEQMRAELTRKIDELERFNRLTVGRELRMVKLKVEVNEMARKAGVDPPYDVPASELSDENSKLSAKAFSKPFHRHLTG
ncbi:MAG: hypothetical protein ACLFV7_11365 [Phycisphaerae bacterium]